MDQKKKKTKGKGQKQKKKETGEDASRKDTSEEKQKRKEGKHLEQEASCTKSVVLSITLPEIDNDMDEEVASIMEGNPEVTEDDVSAAKALVRLQSSRCSSLVLTDTEGTEK